MAVAATIPQVGEVAQDQEAVIIKDSISVAIRTTVIESEREAGAEAGKSIARRIRNTRMSIRRRRTRSTKGTVADLRTGIAVKRPPRRNPRGEGIPLSHLSGLRGLTLHLLSEILQEKMLLTIRINRSNLLTKMKTKLSLWKTERRKF